MNLKDMKDILSDHQFFEVFQPEHLDLMAGCASNVAFKAGEYIWQAEDEVNKFYLIRHGEVAIEIYDPRQRRVITTANKGDVIGWSWIRPPYKAHASVRTSTVTRLIALDAICLREKMETDCLFGYAMLQRFTEIIVNRFEATQLQLLDIYK